MSEMFELMNNFPQTPAAKGVTLSVYHNPGHKCTKRTLLQRSEAGNTGWECGAEPRSVKCAHAVHTLFLLFL